MINLKAVVISGNALPVDKKVLLKRKTDLQIELYNTPMTVGEAFYVTTQLKAVKRLLGIQ